MEKTVITMWLMPILVQFRYLGGAGVVCFILAAIGLYLWEKTPLKTDTQPSLNRTFGYTGSGLIGVILLFSFSNLAVMFLYESSQLFVRYAYLPHHSSDQPKRLLNCSVGIQAFMGMFFVVLSSVLLYKLGPETTSCDVIFCLGVKNQSVIAKTRGATINFFN